MTFNTIPPNTTLPNKNLPIDLALADQLFPILESAAKNMEHLPQLYEDLDYFFWRTFLELFPDPDEPCPPGRAWETLMKLKEHAELSNLTESILRLTHNNDRISAALATLSMVLGRA